MKTSEHKEVDKVCFLFLKFGFKVSFFESIVHVRLMSDAACSLSLALILQNCINRTIRSGKPNILKYILISVVRTTCCTYGSVWV